MTAAVTDAATTTTAAAGDNTTTTTTTTTDATTNATTDAAAAVDWASSFDMASSVVIPSSDSGHIHFHGLLFVERVLLQKVTGVHLICVINCVIHLLVRIRWGGARREGPGRGGWILIHNQN